MLNGRKTIGVIIFDITSYYQSTLCRSLSKYGTEHGYNTLVFSATTMFGNTAGNARGEYNIIHLIPYESLDAIIVCHDTFYNDNVIEDVWNLITTRALCPIVSIRNKVEGYYNILIEDSNAIPELIRHFHDMHHYKQIAFLSGPKNHPDSIRREKQYRDTMAELGLSYPEEYIFEGDFWKNTGEPAVDHYINLETPPEAIICANDYMALSLSREFIMRGYRVPEDFAISGYDDIQDACANTPPLTTCAVSTDELAKLAMDTIYRLLTETPVDKNRYASCFPVIRNSCGCDTHTPLEIIRKRMEQMDRYEDILTESIHNTFVSISLEEVQNAEDIGYFLRLDESPDETPDFYLCLGEGADQKHPQVRIKAPGFATYSHAVFAMKDRERIETSVFETQNLLPPEAIKEEPMTYYIFPIHYLEYNFGYVAAAPHTKKISNQIIHSWLSNIGNSLESLRVRHQKESLLNELNILYIQDPLTNLYNRRGFEKLSATAFEEARVAGKTSMILGIDMNNLKTINDVYGHSHGDTALQAIADAITASSKSNEICARVGGDEFEIFAPDYTEEDAKKFIQRIENNLKKFNKKSGLEYMVSASYGYSIATSNGSQELEFYLKLSDDRLYEYKRQLKAQYGDLSIRNRK